ncbi:hypothetical protein QZH41_019749, partial [Actinostola sp. cb2023]
DRIYFLDKYTEGKANAVVKGFLATNSDEAYKKARVKWCRHAHEFQAKSGKPTSFSNFVKFVRQEAELANDPVFSPEALMRERKKTIVSVKPRNRSGYSHRTNGKPQPGQSFVTNAGENTSTPTNQAAASTDQLCQVCNGKHDLAKCSKFLKSSAEERSEVIRSNKLCFRCFKKGHVSADCQSNPSCEECGKRHHTLLHGAKPKYRTGQSSDTRTRPTRGGDTQPQGAKNNPPATETANSNASSSVSLNSVDDQAQVVITNSKIVPVILYHKDNPQKELKVYALLDDASDTTFVTDKVQQELGIEGIATRLSLSTMLGREVIKVSKIEGLIAERTDRGAKVELPKTYTRERIPSRRDQVPTPEVANKWPHLQRIKNDIPKLDETLDIGLLIGCNCPKALKPKEVITDDYVKFMTKVIDSGFAEKVEPAKSETMRVWYIPHHGVYHPKKPNKIRVVFDCAAQYKNESLNKHLLQGPDLTNSLVGVLHRFRQEPVAFTCDIEGMFHQVKVNEEDRDLLRFLWWENGDTTQEPQEYRMTVHLFGATSSPGCANFALKQTANDYESEFGTATADLLRNDFYVDDGLKSVSTAEQAVKSKCFKPKDFGRIVNTELHHFSDASTKGYGQCSYLRLVNENQRIHCAFVTGKSRVTPLKPVTIPRLELTAAVCSARISQQLHQELEYPIDQDFYWTDSKVVLGYIHNESRRFHVFVANRVQEIQESTRAEQWRYVDTKQNPADEASRGMKARELPMSRWILGPSFLWEEKSKWPTTDSQGGAISEDDPDVKKSVAMATSTEGEERASLERRLEYFSDWYRVKRAIALCIRYVKLLKDRVQERRQLEAKESSQLIVNELEVAERVIVREVQASAFKDEIAELKKLKNEDPKERGFATARRTTVKAHSSIFKIDPFLDEDGILRVGGRLRYSRLTDGIKFPVILPRKSHVTSLIIRHFHERVKHQGKGMTLNEIRSNGFWITGGSSAVSNTIALCVKCQRLRGTVQEQRMADLPKDRLESAPPFTSCGVDYFGPFLVKVGRKEVKRYGVLFTCMASRAIHLEIANSLDTDSFINAYRRFVSRRGPIRQLRSDQGTNFVGARRQLKEALAEMDQDSVKAELLKDNCDWIEFKMNVPSASHMGGAWERQIRTVRNVLSSLLQDNGAQLDDESLRTLMCEAEAIVNSRPLTVDQLTDPESSGPLTPNHLLTMKSRVLLAPPGSFQSADLYCTRRWRRVQHLVNEFWSRWRKEYLVSLQQRQKWIYSRRNLRVDDIVIIKDDNAARNCWQLARVSATYPSLDGLVRKVQVALADSCLDKHGK